MNTSLQIEKILNDDSQGYEIHKKCLIRVLTRYIDDLDSGSEYNINMTRLYRIEFKTDGRYGPNKALDEYVKYYYEKNIPSFESIFGGYNFTSRMTPKKLTTLIYQKVKYGDIKMKKLDNIEVSGECAEMLNRLGFYNHESNTNSIICNHLIKEILCEFNTLSKGRGCEYDISVYPLLMSIISNLSLTRAESMKLLQRRILEVYVNNKDAFNEEFNICNDNKRITVKKLLMLMYRKMRTVK